MLRLLILTILTVSLSGCGLVPLWLTALHTVSDVALTTKTGKSSGEHLLSGITGKDCQFIRVIDGEDVCMTKGNYEEYLLSLECDTYTWNILNRVSCEKDA